MKDQIAQTTARSASFVYRFFSGGVPKHQWFFYLNLFTIEMGAYRDSFDQQKDLERPDCLNYY